MLEKLRAAHAASKLKFFGTHAALADAVRFAEFLGLLKKKRWFVYAKQPFAGPRAVLAYLSRYTHRVAISNSRLLKTDGKTVTFRVKNYRVDGIARYTTMTLDVAEFIRRFLHPRAAKGPTSHTSLRPVRQRHTRRQHRACTQAARRDRGRDREHRGGADTRPGRHQRRAGDSRARASHADLSVLRQQNAHHRGLPARPDATVQSLAAPAVDPDRYVMTIAVAAQQNDDASRWSPAGLADPFAIRRRRSCRAAHSHSEPHHRDLLRRRRSPNTSPAGAITASPAADQRPKYP